MWAGGRRGVRSELGDQSQSKGGQERHGFENREKKGDILRGGSGIRTSRKLSSSLSWAKGILGKTQKNDELGSVTKKKKEIKDT